MEPKILNRHFVPVLEAEESISVMQWNLLSDQLAFDFPAVEREFLEWEYREPRILHEIFRVNADILCLEEVDHYHDTLYPHLAQHGYRGFFSKKPDWHNDGLAILYKEDKFRIIENEVIRFSDSNQIGLYAKMRHMYEGYDFVVCCTHLVSNKAFEQGRVAAIRILLGNLLKFGIDLPVVICGDFNSEPFWTTYQEMIYSPFGFRSVYYNTLFAESEPPFTTYKYRKQLEARTIDYIWTKNFRVTEVLSIPTEHEIGPFGLPGQYYPSDHLALACKLSLSSSIDELENHIVNTYYL
jgi:nocturnin